MNKWKEISAILIVFICFLVIILLTNNKKEVFTSFTTSIPKKTRIHILINSNYLLDELLITELFETQDENLVEKIKDFTLKKGNDNINISDIDCDFSKPFEFIEVLDNKNIIYALKFNLKKSTHESFAKDFVNSRLIGNGNIGYWIFTKKISLKKIKRIFFKDCLVHRFINKENRQFVSFFNSGKLESTAEFSIKKNKISIFSKSKKSKSEQLILAPQGFHFSSKVKLNKPIFLEDISFLRFLNPKNLNFISFNYMGLKIKDEGIPAIPKMELLLTYSSPVSADSIFQLILKQNKLKFQKTYNNHYLINDETFTMRQISKNTIYFSTISTLFKTKKVNSDIYISGDPNNLVKIENAGWKSLFIEMIPGFKTSKNFLQSTKQVTTIIKNKNEELITLEFKNNKQAIHELFKILMSFD